MPRLPPSAAADVFGRRRRALDPPQRRRECRRLGRAVGRSCGRRRRARVRACLARGAGVAGRCDADDGAAAAALAAWRCPVGTRIAHQHQRDQHQHDGADQRRRAAAALRRAICRRARQRRASPQIRQRRELRRCRLRRRRLDFAAPAGPAARRSDADVRARTPPHPSASKRPASSACSVATSRCSCSAACMQRQAGLLARGRQPRARIAARAIALPPRSSISPD